MQIILLSPPGALQSVEDIARYSANNPGAPQMTFAERLHPTPVSGEFFELIVAGYDRLQNVLIDAMLFEIVKAIFHAVKPSIDSITIGVQGGSSQKVISMDRKDGPEPAKESLRKALE